MQRQRVCQGKKKSRFGQKLTRMEMCFEKLTDIMRQSQLTSDNGIKALVSFRQDVSSSSPSDSQDEISCPASVSKMPCLAPVSIDENKTEANYSTAFEKIKISPDFRENHGNIQHIGHKYLNRITKEAEHNQDFEKQIISIKRDQQSIEQKTIEQQLRIDDNTEHNERDRQHHAPIDDNKQSKMKSLNSELMNDQDRLKAISKEADKSRDMDKERNKNKERAGTYNIVARNCFANEEQCRKPSEKKISSFFDNCTPSSKIKEANKQSKEANKQIKETKKQIKEPKKQIKEPKKYSMKKVSSSQKGKLNVNGKSTVDKTFEQLYLSPTYISPDKHCNLELQIVMKINELKRRKNLCDVESCYLQSSLRVTRQELLKALRQMKSYSQESFLNTYILKSVVKFLSQFEAEIYVLDSDSQEHNDQVGILASPERLVTIINHLPEIIRVSGVLSQVRCCELFAEKRFVDGKILAMHKEYLSEQPLFQYLCSLHTYVQFLLNNNMIHETKRSKLFAEPIRKPKGHERLQSARAEVCDSSRKHAFSVSKLYKEELTTQLRKDKLRKPRK